MSELSSLVGAGRNPLLKLCLLILVSKLELPAESLGIQRFLGWTTGQALLDKDPPDAVVGIQMTT